jgi:hypothetical protein
MKSSGFFGGGKPPSVATRVSLQTPGRAATPAISVGNTPQIWHFGSCFIKSMHGPKPCA